MLRLYSRTTFFLEYYDINLVFLLNSFLNMALILCHSLSHYLFIFFITIIYYYYYSTQKFASDAKSERPNVKMRC